ncbi:hypothetical protein HMPREF9124_2340 [Oribacterium sp. oral taxon 108 str. F0425]|nr:hypothetical protein HMPREF9124_2340 [Oribacterium sp. oral taxon 108 str. F0425]
MLFCYHFEGGLRNLYLQEKVPELSMKSFFISYILCNCV